MAHLPRQAKRTHCTLPVSNWDRASFQSRTGFSECGQNAVTPSLPDGRERQHRAMASCKAGPHAGLAPPVHWPERLGPQAGNPGGRGGGRGGGGGGGGGGRGRRLGPEPRTPSRHSRGWATRVSREASVPHTRSRLPKIGKKHPRTSDVVFVPDVGPLQRPNILKSRPSRFVRDAGIRGPWLI